MAATTSFYFGIFKKIQACAGIGGGYPHADAASDESLGFNVETADDKGFFAPLNHDHIVAPGGFSPPLKPLVEQHDPSFPNDPTKYLLAYPVLPASDPLSNIPDKNPLYAMFKASLTANGAIVKSSWLVPTVAVQVGGPLWPIMPMCEDLANKSELVKLWIEFNKPGPFTLVKSFGDWITAGKPNDTPKSSLNFTQPPQTASDHPVLFVCSKLADDGVRPGAGLDKSWATSRIYLVNPDGPAMGAKAYPSKLSPGAQYNLVAQIGNSGGTAGRLGQLLVNPAVNVRADAYPFNTSMSSLGVSLPALSNLDIASQNGKFEEYVFRAGSYSLAGFRFDVDKVFNELAMTLDAAAVNNPDLLNGVPAKEWLTNAHPCVKVRIWSDSNNPLPLDTDSPTTNRRIAQHNLAMFDHLFLSQPPKPPSPAPWHHFIVEQPLTLFDQGKGKSTIRLTLLSTLPPEAFKLFVAMSEPVFRRYFSAGKGMNGFVVATDKELARDLPRGRTRPFPDAVILRPTSLASALEFTIDAKHRLLGMSLALVHDAARHPTRPTGSVSVVHDVLRGRERAATAVGGFTIEVASNRDAAART